MKSLVFATILVSFCAVLVLSQNPTSLIRWGTRKSSDVLIGRFGAVKPKSWLKVQSVTFSYREKRGVARNISAILFYGGYKAEGTPTLLAGGIGRNFTSIRLSSKRGQGLNVTVELYGPRIKWN